MNNQSYKEIKQNPYVFQTYAYAMENIKCYAESLNAICIKATHNTDDIIDFSELLAEYSEIIYELFVWNVYFEYIQHTNIFTRKEFSQLTLVSGNIKIEEYQESLNTLKIKVDEKLQDLKNSFPEYQNSIIQFSSQLNRLGVTNTNTYLFIRGHEIYSTVLNFLKSVCKELEGRYIKQIKSLAETGKNSSDNIRNYTNSRLSVKELLFGNDKFIDCFLFQKITTDIENYLALFKQNTQGLNHV